MVPTDFLFSLLTAEDLEDSVCGGPGEGAPDLDLLRSLTIYEAGLKESDEHVAHFWAALESLSPAQQRGFVKFASNQERLPAVSPGGEGPPPPPYPMKIMSARTGSAPDPDAVNIRAETCMFMVRLPVYSSFAVMRQKILLAISSAYDPLSG